MASIHQSLCESCVIWKLTEQNWIQIPGEGIAWPLLHFAYIVYIHLWQNVYDYYITTVFPQLLKMNFCTDPSENWQFVIAVYKQYKQYVAYVRQYLLQRFEFNFVLSVFTWHKNHKVTDGWRPQMRFDSVKTAIFGGCVSHRIVDYINKDICWFLHPLMI